MCIISFVFLFLRVFIKRFLSGVLSQCLLLYVTAQNFNLRELKLNIRAVLVQWVDQLLAHRFFLVQ